MPTAELKSIKDIEGKIFRIPAYQRGYRWTRRQIKELVCDLQEFYESHTANIYCLQPIVLEEKVDDKTGENYFNVIDGQQRLTSLYLVGAAYRWLKTSGTRPTYTGYTLKYEEKEDLEKLLDEIGSCTSKEYENKLNHWKSTYTDIDSQNVINVLEFLTTPDANWYPEDLLHDIHRCLDEGKKDICVIWHNLESDGSDSDNAIETFANINANKIPLTDAELIKAVLMQAYGRSTIESEDEAPSASAVLQEATFANQWEAIERGLNKNDFWCFFVRKIAGYKTRIDLLFEIWLATEGVSLSNDDHALYRAILDKLQTDGIEKIWRHGVVTIYETLQDWYQDYYIYHMIGACSLLGKKESNAEFVCKLYQEYNQKTQTQFRDKLRDLLKERYDMVMQKPGTLRALSYENYPDETKSVLFLFNIALLLNAHKACPSNTAERFPFDYYKSTGIEIEHINPRHPDTKANDETVATWRSDMEIVVEENDKVSMITEKKKRTATNIAAWENAAEVHSIGNLTLVDKQLNIGFSNGSFRDKRNHVLSAMLGEKVAIKTGEKEYPKSVLFPGARWVFMRQWRTDVDSRLSPELMTKDYWSKAEREFYVDKLENSLQLLLGSLTNEGTEEEEV